METTNRGCAAGIWKFLAASLLWVACVPAFATGQVETYDYDAAGNIVGIHRVAASSPLAITSFSPTHGDVGTRVVVRGIGFSASPAANTVKFNGTATPTLAATTTQLLVAVPSGATTGPISVTVGATTATSSGTFTVGAASPAPYIASVSPWSGAIGSTVSIYGTNLAPQPGQTSVSINGVAAAITMASNAQVDFKVPSAVGAGRIMVTTPFGQATTTDVFGVDPSGIAPASVAWYPLLTTADPPRSVSLTAGKYAAFPFEGTAGDFLSLQLSAFTSSNNALSYTVYNATGASVASGTLLPGKASIHLPRLPATGMYSVFFGSGTGTNQFAVALEANVLTAIDSPALTVSTTSAGQTKRLIFDANAGDNIGLGISNLVLSNYQYSFVSVYVYQPDGTQLSSNYGDCSVANTGCGLDLRALPVTGRYSLVVQPPFPNSDPTLTMSYKLSLPRELAPTFVANMPATVSLGAGQNALATFTATAGASYGLQVGGVTTVPATRSVSLTIRKPDGTTLTTASTNGGYAFNLANVPATGTYSVYIDPALGSSAAATFVLVPSASAAVAVDGAASNISTSGLPGTYAYFTFQGAQGDNIGLGISSLTLTNAVQGFVSIYVYGPDGTELANNYGDCTLSNGGCAMNLANLPVGGTYAVIVRPPFPNNDRVLTMGFSVKVSHDLVVALAPGTPTSVTLAAGQNASVTFDGTAGASYGLQVAGVTTLPANQNVALTIRKPGGAVLTSASTNGGYAFNLASVPATGTYSVFIDPALASSASMTLVLVPSASAAVAIDGASTSVSTSGLPGAYAYFSFVGTQGDNVGVGISSLTLTNAVQGFVSMYVYRPDGTELASNYGDCMPSNVGCAINLANLPASGTYGVIVRPPFPANDRVLTMGFNAWASHDVAAALTPGTTSGMSLGFGQNARLTFSGTTGDAVALEFGGMQTTPANRSVVLTVLKPNGTTLASGTAYGGYTFSLPNLPMTGTYTAFVDPSYGASTTLSALLLPAASASVPVDGGGVAFDTSPLPASFGYFNFTATQGENLGLGIGGMSLANNSNTYVSLAIYKPDGSQWGNNINCVASTGCDLNLAGVPATGMYVVVLRPAANDPAITMSFTATVSHDVVAALTPGTPVNASLASGQNGRFTFSGTAATNTSIQISGISTTPTARSLALSVMKPDGTVLASTVATSGYTFNLTNLPVTGTYVLFVDPVSGVAASFQAVQP